MNNSSPTGIATNAFGFMGIMFDVIAALLALLSSTVIQARVSVIDRILSNVAKLNHDQLTAFLVDMESVSERETKFVRAMIQDIAQPFLKRLTVAARQNGGEYENLSAIDEDHFNDRANGPQIVKYCSEIDRIRVVGDAAGVSMRLGILSFMASIVCLAIATQPVAVWACTVTACSCVFFLPCLKYLQYFGLRMQISLLRILFDLIFHQDCQALSKHSCRDRLPDEIVRLQLISLRLGSR